MSYIKNIPFRLRFDAKNGDTIQINLVDVAEAPTWFGKVGGVINLTKPPFKVTKFEAKSRKDGDLLRDVSEVTVQNTETGEVIVLPKQQEVNSPTSFAVLEYKWTGKTVRGEEEPGVLPSSLKTRPKIPSSTRRLTSTKRRSRSSKRTTTKRFVIKKAEPVKPISSH